MDEDFNYYPQKCYYCEEEIPQGEVTVTENGNTYCEFCGEDRIKYLTHEREDFSVEFGRAR